MIHSCFAFHLNILSDLRLKAPECSLTKGNENIHIKLGEYLKRNKKNQSTFSFKVGNHKALFRYAHVADFEIFRGREIVIKPELNVSRDLLCDTVLGTPMGILLLQRGHIVFHASAVNVCGKTICIVGDSGKGKSSTALALVQLGNKFVSDDVVAINCQSHEVYRSYPWMKIDVRLCDSLRINRDKIEILSYSEDKARYSLPEKSINSTTVSELGCFCCLEWGDDYSIDVLNKAQTLLSIIPHEYSYVPKNGNILEEKARFEKTANLVRNVPCLKITRPREISGLPKMAEMIVSKLSEL